MRNGKWICPLILEIFFSACFRDFGKGRRISCCGVPLYAGMLVHLVKEAFMWFLPANLALDTIVFLASLWVFLHIISLKMFLFQIYEGFRELF